MWSTPKPSSVRTRRYSKEIPHLRMIRFLRIWNLIASRCPPAAVLG